MTETINNRAFRNVNVLTELTSFNGSDLVKIYTPGFVPKTRPQERYSAFITSLRATVDINSIAELVIPDTNPLDSEEKQRQQQAVAIGNTPKKGLELYLTIANENPILVGEIYLFNRRPYYFIPLIKYFTDSATFDCGSTTTISVRITDIGSGVLGSIDRVTIIGSVVEESPLQQPIYFQMAGGGFVPNPTQPTPTSSAIGNDNSAGNNSQVGN